MKSKNWLIGFFAILFIGIGSYMIANYYLDPVGYFSVEHNSKEVKDDDMVRPSKTKYVLAHKDEIEGVVLCGSKGGVLDPKILKEYTGLNYYNMYVNIGTFTDYLAYTRFCIEKTNVKEITLHLSSFDSVYFDRSKEATNLNIPKLAVGTRWELFQEKLGFLMPELKTVQNRIKELKENKKVWAVAALSDGMRIWNNYIPAFKEGGEKFEKYIEKNVLEDFNKEMKKLSTGKNSNYKASYEKNIEALRELKKLCDENDITLKVMIGAAFVSEKSGYEGDYYYDYLYQIVNVAGEVWDFSDYNEVNSNPYNFINRRHCSYAVGDLELATMYGYDSHEGFGILLTKDNILSYLEQRKADWKRISDEYLEKGEMELPGMDDPSYIPWNRLDDFYSRL